MTLKIIIFLSLLWGIEGSHILGIFSTPDVDHFMLGSRLMEALAQKGHQITFVAPFTPEFQNENVTTVEILQEIELQEVNKLYTNFMERVNMNFITRTMHMYSSSYDITEAVLTDSKFQALLQNPKKYDLIITEYYMNEALFGLSSYFYAPMILLSPLPSSSLMNELFANPAPSSYVPNILSGLTGRMSFPQRLHNFFCNAFNKHYKYYLALPWQEYLLKKYIDKNLSINEAIENVNLILLNSHASVTEPAPHTPNMIEVGGMHMAPPKPLPRDLENFIRKSSGVVYIALHPDLTASSLGREKVAVILNGLEKLSNLNVVWNIDADEDIGPVPENVMVVTDVPHQDVISHENVVAFVTDGNLMRIFEAVYYAKPIVAIPLVDDQESNVAKAVEDSYAKGISFDELSGKKIDEQIRDVLKNSLYSYNVLKRSRHFKERPISPIDEAVYWAEYVIRQGDPKHLQSTGVHLSMFKRHMVDIIILLTVIDIVLFLIFYYVIKHIIHLGFKKRLERKSRRYVQLENEAGQNKL
ncbi:unnamed protein product [Phyllotreta striolata]|uniref:Uncharacterized protein n=1 Tax=Phyllotreta striolata TaxID=444603 RepID=A0A9N9XRZ7_PHYSR|nr:unnamed protein product [Phyllotreta striolata]